MKQPPKNLERKAPPLSESEIDEILQSDDKKQKTSPQINQQDQVQNSTQTERVPSPTLVRLKFQDELEKDDLRKAFSHLSLVKNISKER